MPEYAPPASLEGFLTSEAKISLVVGPVGSCKTTAGIIKIAYHASKMAACTDGIRRSRCIWVRQTREQLRDSSVPDFLEWFPNGEAGIYMRSEMRFTMKFADVECEVLFRGLDDSDDVRRLLSTQASFAVIEEFRELDKDLFEALEVRLGRYPNGKMVPHRPEWGLSEEGHPIRGCVTDEGKSNQHMWGMTNPPDLETFWEEYLTNPPPKAEVFFQPSALSPEADWLHYLPAGYYQTAAEGKSQEFIDVYIHAKFGKTLSGTPVFKTFDADVHVAKHSLTPIRMGGYPIIVAMDFGLCPAAAVMQATPTGRAIVLDELVSDGMGILRFCREKLNPLMQRKYENMPIVVIGDPAGVQRTQTDEKTVYDILKAEGYEAIPAKTNSIVARIASVESLLSKRLDGGGALVIDPACTTIIGGLRGKYRYKTRRDGSAEATPDKNAWSHIMDALQYGALHIDTTVGGKKRAAARVEVRTVSAAGWT